MDQDTVVGLPIMSGRQLISALVTEGFEIRIAFWARPTEAEKWRLYLASPMADKDPRLAYRRVLDLLRSMPEVDIDPFEIRLLRSDDSLTDAASALLEQKSRSSSHGLHNPKPYPRMVRYDGGTLAGIDMDGAYIYPLSELKAPV